jgi:hypothetical protein
VTTVTDNAACFTTPQVATRWVEAVRKRRAFS